jgi:hypothetical protein
MPEGKSTQKTAETNTKEEETPTTAAGQLALSFKLLARRIDALFPNYRSPDAVALALARFTPKMLAITLLLLCAGIIGSQLNIWVADFLWGIPSLGVISIGLGFWLFSSSFVMRPDLSEEARAALHRAMGLQWIALVAGLLTILYYLALAIDLF